MIAARPMLRRQRGQPEHRQQAPPRTARRPSAVVQVGVRSAASRPVPDQGDEGGERAAPDRDRRRCSTEATEPVVAEAGDDGQDDHRQDVVDDGRAEDDAGLRAGDHAEVAQHARGDPDAGRDHRRADEDRLDRSGGRAAAP